MEELSAQIHEQVGVIIRAIRRLGTESPSFENGIPSVLLADKEASAARQKVLAMTDELHALLSDPGQLLAAQTNPAISANAICELGLVGTLPPDSPGRKIEDMAEEAGIPSRLAKRLMKHAEAHKIYRESSPGVFSHTAASKLLASDVSCQKWLNTGANDIVPASYKIPKAFQKYGPSGEPNQAVSNPQLSVDEPGECSADGLKGWNIEHCLSGSVFEELDKSPERADSFSGAMRFISKNPGFDMRHLFDNFDWQSLSGKTLTDVGGSTGHASMYIAERVPDLRCVVQDRPEVIDQFRRSASSALAHRMSYEAHDMFQDQTRQSDAFLLRLVLHDWSEEYARKILKALIPGMRSGTKVLVQDMILPGHGDDISHFHQKIMRGFDLNMLGLQNGQERDVDDWKELFTSTDRRFFLSRVYRSPESVFGLLEYTWEGDS